MKKIVGFDQAIGSAGGRASGQVGVEGSNVKIMAEATFPLVKVLDPAMKVIDDMVDKVEAWIPGDQKSMAAKLKAEAREQLVALLSEAPAAAAPQPE